MKAISRKTKPEKTKKIEVRKRKKEEPKLSRQKKKGSKS